MVERDPQKRYPGGITWVDGLPKKPGRLKSTLIWLRDNVLAALIIAAVSGTSAFLLGRWLHSTPQQSQESSPAETTNHPES
jgi:hypothetical protein